MLGGVMLISMVFEKTDKSHLWYLVKLPLVFLNSGHTFSGFSSHLLKCLFTLLPLIHITQPPQHEAFFFSPLLWASDLNRFFSSQSAVLFSVLIEWLFALSLSCAWSLKGDKTSIWTEISLLTSTSSVSPDFESPSSPPSWLWPYCCRKGAQQPDLQQCKLPVKEGSTATWRTIYKLTVALLL